MAADENEVDHGRRNVSSPDNVGDTLNKSSDIQPTIDQYLQRSKSRKKRTKSSSKRRTKQRLLRREGLPQIEETDEEGSDDDLVDSEMSDNCTTDDSTESTERLATDLPLDKNQTHVKQRSFQRVTVKFEFAVHNKKARKSTRDLHKEVVTLIKQRFPKNILEVHTNTGKTIDMMNCSSEEHSQEFQVHILKASKYGTKHVIVHQFTMNKSMSTIKRDTTICPFLDKHDIYLKLHAFREEDWDTVPIGWKLYTHPLRENLTTVKADISSFLQAEQKISLHKAQDLFAITVGTPTALYNDQKYDTRAFIIETLRSERESMNTRLQKLYSKNSAYVPLTTKYKDPEGAAAAIQLQNQYIKDFRTITIQGVTETMMFYMEERIKAISGVFSIEKTSETSTMGKWYIVTNMTNFRSTLTSLHDERSNFTQDIPPGQDSIKPDGFPPEVEIQTLAERKRVQIPSKTAMNTDSSVDDNSDYSADTWKAMAPLLPQDGDNQTTPDTIFIPMNKKSDRRTWSDIASIDSASDDDSSRKAKNSATVTNATASGAPIQPVIGTSQSPASKGSEDNQISTLTDQQSVQILQATVQNMEVKMSNMSETIDKLTAYIHEHLQMNQAQYNKGHTSSASVSAKPLPAVLPEDLYMTRIEAQEVLQGIISRELSREMEKYFSPTRHSQPTSVSTIEVSNHPTYKTPTKSPPTKKRDRSMTPTFPRPPNIEPPDGVSQAERPFHLDKPTPSGDTSEDYTVPTELEEALATIQMPNAQIPVNDRMKITADDDIIPKRLEFAQARSRNE